MQYHLIKYPGCKWNKHLALVDDPKLKDYLPHTALFNIDNFKQFISQYPTFFLKPRLGGGGFGVYKVAKQGRYFTLYYGSYRRKYAKVSELYRALERRCRNKQYIIQKGIDLMQVSARLVDFRVVLLKQKNQWVYMGVMGKHAAKHKFVTNQANGGNAIRFKRALTLGLNLSEKQCEKLHDKLRNTSLSIAHKMNETFKNITELGIDVGIDKQGHIWLLEANTKPHFNLFKSHEDNTLYNKIMTVTKELRAQSPQ